METQGVRVERGDARVAVSEQERARLDEMYADQGITPEFIQERMEIRQPLKIQGEYSDTFYQATNGHIDVLYINSSDPLKILREQCQVQGKRVLTVAGSGEQLPLFTLAGAEAVQAFDVSWISALWGELKLRAYQILSFDELVTCLQAWREAKMDMAEWRWHSIIDVKIYQEKLRPALSRTARLAFDCLLHEDPDHQFSVRGQDIKGKHPSGLSTRLRGKDLLGDGVVSRETLPGLQRALASVEYTFRWQPLDAIQDVGKYDVLYMSNIGYVAKDIMRIVNQVLQRGVKTVYCTMTDRDYVIFMNAADPKVRRTQTHYTVPGLQTSSMKLPETVYEGVLGSPDVPREGDVSELPIRVRVCGNDQAAICGTLIEITRA